MTEVPTTMRALELREQTDRPVLTEKIVPQPRPGEVLVRVAAAPINPNDILFLRDQYEIEKPRPVVPGFEGSGVVVAAGGGLMARFLVGRRVAFAAGDGDGTWAEYAVAPAMRCVPLRGSVDLDQGATLLTNPLTAWVLASRARREGHRAVVLTAAAGALGQMLNRLFFRNRQAVINVVRKAAQVETLRAQGAAHVLDSSAADFDARLLALSAELGATLLLDAVGGETTGRVLAAMPDGSVARVYGMLSSEPCRLDVSDLVFRSKKVEGFTMYEWLRTTSLLGQMRAVGKVQGLVNDVLATRVQAKSPLGDHARALTLAHESASQGKVLLAP
jgi:NADPH:quinone reductase-like Zn-dependent oxidoreductase